MDRPLTIQFPVEPVQPREDAVRAASDALSPNPGIVYVEMVPYAEKIGSVLIPDHMAQRTRADVGIVLASGPNRSPSDKTDPQDICAEPPEPGTVVGLMPYKGDSYAGFRAGKYRSHGRIVRVIGNASTEKRFWLTDWNDAIMFTLEGKLIVPQGKWCLVRRDSLASKESAIHLPDSQSYRSGKGFIVAHGAQAGANGASISRCHYRQSAITVDTDFAEDFLKETDPGYSGDPRDYCFIKWFDILATLNE